jgi:hypothetical protein
VSSADQIISADSAEIERNLDASFSYVVFERETGADGDHGCSEIVGLFSRLKKRVIKSELYLDRRGGRFMLIIATDPKEARKGHHICGRSTWLVHNGHQASFRGAGFLTIRGYTILAIMRAVERRRRAAASLIGAVIQRRRCGS